MYNQVSPYQYALNNPVRLIDKDGRIVATPMLNSDGTKQTHETNRDVGGYHVSAKYEKYTIYTNAGTPVEAWKLMEGEEKVTDADGKTVNAASVGISMESNCYGHVLTSGYFYLPFFDQIQNDEDAAKADAFLTQVLAEEGIAVDWSGDGSPRSASIADGFVETSYGKQSRQYQHIAIRSANGQGWSADHGYWTSVTNVGFAQAAHQNGILDPVYFSYWPFVDNRPIKHYNGTTTLNMDQLRNNGATNLEIMRFINSLIAYYFR